MIDSVLIHSAEICLKGNNRGLFEDQLVRNLTDRLAGLGAFRVLKRQGSFLLLHDGPLTDGQIGSLKRRLRTVFGLSHFLLAERCAAQLPAIEATAVRIMSGRPPGTFKVETRRSDKSFEPASPEVSRLVGGRVLGDVPGQSVDVHAPAVRLQIEIGPNEAFVAADRVDGWGGLPVGVSGRVVTLLSGGIDSPVAAWQMMRRGCQAIFVHFHSYPFVSQRSVDKVKRLAAVLNDFQAPSTLYLVPFADVQRAIVDKCDEALRVLLYRRQMLRIAEMAARQEKALGLVTGDSIGQVASQTLENLATVSAAASLPIYRPLIGENKENISDLAKNIGTYGISIEPHDDCCSLFTPRRPATRAAAADAEREEAAYPAAELAAAAWQKAEKVLISAKTWDIETGRRP